MSHLVEIRDLKKSSKCRILSILIFLMASCHTFHAAAPPRRARPARSVCNILQIHYERRASGRKVYRVIHGQACSKCISRDICVAKCISMQSCAIKVQNFALKETLAWPECTCRDMLQLLHRELAAGVNYVQRTLRKVNRIKVTLNKHPRISSMCVAW